VLGNEGPERLSVRQVTWFSGAIADDVDTPVHDVDAAFFGYGAGQNIVGEEGSRVRGHVVIHHLEIDRVLLLHGGDPASYLFAITGDVEKPIVAFADETVRGCARRDGSAIDWNRDGASEGAEARIDDIGGAVDCDGDEHMLSHAFVACFEKKDAGCMSDGGKADRLQSGVYEACVFEAVATAAGTDDLGLQCLRVEPDGAAEKDIEAFEREAGDMGLEDASEGIVGRSAGAGVIDASEVGVEVEGLRHVAMTPGVGALCRAQTLQLFKLGRVAVLNLYRIGGL